MTKKAHKDISFEENIESLNLLVKRMESGEVPLAELVKEYEAGSQLLKVCEWQLKDAELKVSQLKGSARSEEDVETFELDYE